MFLQDAAQPGFQIKTRKKLTQMGIILLFKEERDATLPSHAYIINQTN